VKSRNGFLPDGTIDTDLSFPPPKAITSHPGVEEALDGPSQGFDYKWNVYLKKGWVFERGRMAGSRTGNFNYVADFRFAHPIKITS
jgi:hypothetical protein